MRPLKITAIFFFVLFIASLASAGTNDDILGRARKLVEEKKYGQAIEEYKKINDWLRRDPGLVIEFARVYTYSDSHDDAIRLFEEVRTTHPDREAEILRELGDQYKWKGDYKSSIEAYEKAMKNNPADIVVKRGLVEAIDWDKKQKERAAKYNEVLDAAGPIAARPETNDDILGNARKLVEEKKYEEAIGEYKKIDAWLRHDPGLVIEFARVYTYVDSHDEAIMLFEEVRASRPDREAEILRELADQYKWNGNLPRSIAAYQDALKSDPGDLRAELGLAEVMTWSGKKREALAHYDSVLKKEPGSIQALLGKAEVLSKTDRLEDANRIYRRVLEKDPKNFTAKDGLARNLVWGGYHKEGVGAYRELIKEFPDNAQALEGLAYALHWGGQDGEALTTVREALRLAPERNASKELVGNIRSSAMPYVTDYNAYWEDKNKLSVEIHGARSGLYPDYNTRVEGVYEWRKSRQKGNTSSRINSGGLGLFRRFSEELEMNSYLYGTNFGNVDYTAFTTDTWLTVRPSDIWRFDLSYNRGTFDDVGSIMNKVIVNSGGVSADFRPNRFLFLSGSVKRGLYSDGNTQNTFFGKAEYRLMQKPYVKAYYNYYYSGWGKVMNTGYFNPIKMDSHAGGLYVSSDMTKNLFWECQGSGGYEYQTPKAYHPTYFFGGTINYKIGKDWTISLHGDTFKAFVDPNSQGYSRQVVILAITYNKGAEAPELFRTTAPSRPATGR
jgi:tetratricopeptide (TPR) repeat protein